MRWIYAALLSVTLLGCGTHSIEQYEGTTPALTLEQFFDGELKAYGLVLDRNGGLMRRFEVDLVADWDGNKGLIKEWFIFDDGEKTTRVWELTKTSDNTYEGTAGDVVGTAEGTINGSALYWKYELQVPVGDTIYDLTLDDWMFLFDEQRLFNKTDMTKYGFKVGEIILFIEKVNPKSSRIASTNTQ
ncbi:DUF3833 domain-containing protein [Vibrio mexicanus]|uniref:DUF3833 domain-containing protein n=1 Tax=Vibrio mexicanus TaxID=1004326 RepID=UPI00063CDEC1|nr:DUF3833 domain-containing protein [Vibrio mexicanus]